MFTGGSVYNRRRACVDGLLSSGLYANGDSQEGQSITGTRACVDGLLCSGICANGEVSLSPAATMVQMPAHVGQLDSGTDHFSNAYRLYSDSNQLNAL